MSIKYTANISKIPKNSTIFHIEYNDELKHNTCKQTHCGILHFNADNMHHSLSNAIEKLEAYIKLWDNENIYIHIPDKLLKLNNSDHLQFILAHVVNNIFKNIYKSKTKVIIYHNGKNTKSHVNDIISIITNVQEARKLSMLPGNMAKPVSIANKLQKLFKGIPKVNTTILNKNYLQKNNFGLLLAVNQASASKPCMLVVERKVNSKYPTVCILGKGITFDSGGLSIKSIRGMQTMKYDKTGAIDGALSLLHMVKTKSFNKINLIGIFPFAENVISSNAVLPGDVITSLSGKTVEITDPDAEGRLILADALAYSKKYKPDFIIDVATLTGHSDSINCWHNGYYFTNSSKIKTLFEERTDKIGERMLPMPYWPEHSSVLNSPVADLVNSPSKCSDAFTAALFLKEFVPEKSTWLHVDLAHTDTNEIANGNGIRSIIDIVIQYFQKN